MLSLITVLLCAQGQVRAELAVRGGPMAMGTGLRHVCRVAVGNAGPCEWPEGEPINLSYHWTTERGAMVEFDGRRTPLPLPLGSGMGVELDLEVIAPPDPGRYRLVVDAVWEHRFWFADLPGRKAAVMPVEVRPSGLEIRGASPAAAVCRSSRACRVTVVNRGPFPVASGQGLRVGCRWDPVGSARPDEEGAIVTLDRALAPGEAWSGDVPVVFPGRQGVFRVVWTLEGDGGVLARDPTPAPLVCVKGSTLVLAGSILPLIMLILPGWRRRAWAWAGLVPWVWFVLSVGWKVMGTAEATHQVPGARVAALAVVSAGLLGLPLLLCPWRTRTVGLWVLNATVSLTIVADLVYFRYFGDLPSAATLLLAGQLGAVKASIPSLAGQGVLFPLADLPLAALLWVLIARRSPDPPRGARHRMAAAAAVVVLAATLAAVEIARAAGEASGLFRQRFKNAFLAGELGVVNYHAFDLAEWATRKVRDRARLGADRERVRRWFSDPPGGPPKPSPLHGRAAGLNFLVIQEESLEAFPLDCTLDGVPVMPFLRGARGACLEFTGFYDGTGHGRTSDAELMLLTSLHPSPRGSAFFLNGGNQFRTLAHLFRQRGYATLFAHPSDPGFWNRAPVYAGFGFDRLLFQQDFTPGKTIGWGLADDGFFQQVVRRLERLPQPFFAMLVTLTDHHPYQDLPVPKAELPLGDLEGTMPGRYLKVCREKDRALEGMVRLLREDGLLSNTVVVIYGDHGGGLAWTAGALRAAGMAGEDDLDRCGLKRLPLLIRVPGVAPGIVPKAGGHTDLGPTLMDLAGIDGAGAPVLGRSLLAPGEGWAVFPDTSFRTDRLQLVRWGLSGRPECWDLAARTETDIARCRPDYDRTVERLEVSAAVLRGDLVPELLPLGTGNAGAPAGVTLGGTAPRGPLR